MLRLFFGKKDGAAGYHKAMSTKADTFRPLVYFLRDRSIATQSKNIELLAWLIDYEPRPNEFEYPGEEPGQAIIEQDQTKDFPINKTTSDEEKKIEETTPGPAGGKKLPIKKIILAGCTALVLALIIYLWSIQTVYPNNQKYMYWHEDHYQPVSGNEKTGEAEIIPFDSLTLARFKKITRPDTLTAASIHKAWYIRLNGDYQFYTDSGPVPNHPDRRLLKLSATILNSSYPRR